MPHSQSLLISENGEAQSRLIFESFIIQVEKNLIGQGHHQISHFRDKTLQTMETSSFFIFKAIILVFFL